MCTYLDVAENIGLSWYQVSWL